MSIQNLILQHPTGYLNRNEPPMKSLIILQPSFLFFSLRFLLQSPNVTKIGAVCESETVKAYVSIKDALPAYSRGPTSTKVYTPLEKLLAGS